MIRFQHCADTALHSITIPRFMMLSVVVFSATSWKYLEVVVREAWQVKNTFIEVSDSDNDKEEEFKEGTLLSRELGCPLIPRK